MSLPRLSPWPHGGSLYGGTDLSLLHLCMAFPPLPTTCYLTGLHPDHRSHYWRSEQALTGRSCPASSPLLLHISLLVSETESHYVTQVKAGFAVSILLSPLLECGNYRGVSHAWLLSFLIYSVYVCTSVNMHVMVRGQLAGVGSLLPPHGS